MDELFASIASNVGIDPELAQKAVGMILGFLQKEGPAEQIAQMMAAMPDAQALIDGAPEAGGGLLGGGVMGLGSALMGMGLGMGEISGVAKETVAFARAQAGEEAVDQVIAAIPGLGQFV
ncbi:DUF2267 domain-containing protein [Oricola sp.]|uniref:DUF2267 domain-containing protein n=1 Tax=Oricola sp. TaxID=1979950 RepID=UPI003BA8A7CB